MELVKESERSVFYKDFAHSPSKLKATTKALKNQYPNRKLVACMELHTFSSLNKEFIPQYSETLDAADQAVVFFSEHALKMKKMPSLDEGFISQAFKHPRLNVLSSLESLQQFLEEVDTENGNLLLMTSGNFDKLPLKETLLT